MDKRINDTFEKLKSVSLSETERISMRNNLQAFMAEHPVHFKPTLADRFVALIGFFNSHTVMRGVSFAFALVLVVTGGTVYAAESALPGEPLYAVKVNFTEEIQSVFTSSESAKAEWQAERLQRRLIEAEELAADGKLSDVARVAIEREINERALGFTASVEALESSDHGIVDAGAVQTKLQASLVGHERVLAKMQTNRPDTAPSIAPIITQVKEKASDSAERRENIAKRVKSRDKREVRTAAANSRHIADTALSAVMAKANAMHATSSSVVVAQAGMKEVERVINDGDTKLKQGNYSEAYDRYQEALRAAHTVDVDLEATSKWGVILLDNGRPTLSAPVPLEQRDPARE